MSEFDLRMNIGLGGLQQKNLATEIREKAHAAKVDGAEHAGPSFMDTLQSALGQVNELQTKADHAVLDFSSGKDTNLHDVMIAMEKADVSLRTLGQVRNKMVEAYQDILKMQV